jgi:hypothetical protein
MWNLLRLESHDERIDPFQCSFSSQTEYRFHEACNPEARNLVLLLTPNAMFMNLCDDSRLHAGSEDWVHGPTFASFRRRVKDHVIDATVVLAAVILARQTILDKLAKRLNHAHVLEPVVVRLSVAAAVRLV